LNEFVEAEFPEQETPEPTAPTTAPAAPSIVPAVSQPSKPAAPKGGIWTRTSQKPDMWTFFPSPRIEGAVAPTYRPQGLPGAWEQWNNGFTLQWIFVTPCTPTFK